MSVGPCARDLIAKVATVVPEHLRPFIAEPTVGAPPTRVCWTDGLDAAKTRLWIRSGRKNRIRYRHQNGQDSERTIWPVIIGYAETVRLLAAWCESRRGFRHFRTNRILGADFLDERYSYRPSDLRARWKRASLRPSAACACLREADAGNKHGFGGRTPFII